MPTWLQAPPTFLVFVSGMWISGNCQFFSDHDYTSFGCCSTWSKQLLSVLQREKWGCWCLVLFVSINFQRKDALVKIFPWWGDWNVEWKMPFAQNLNSLGSWIQRHPFRGITLWCFPALRYRAINLHFNGVAMLTSSPCHFHGPSMSSFLMGFWVIFPSKIHL